jgi:hypothetical protein
MYKQDNANNLLNRLDSITGEERIEILKDLYRGNTYNNSEQALRHGLETLALVKELESDGFWNQITRITHIIDCLFATPKCYVYPNKNKYAK